MSVIKQSPVNIIQNIVQENENQIEHNSNMPTDTIKFRRKLSRINTKMRRVIQKIENSIPKKIGSIYDRKTVKVKAVKILGSITDRMYNNTTEEKDDFNVFSNEDDKIKALMSKFKEKIAKDKIPKLIRRKMAFNKLYNITESSIKQLDYVKKRKRQYSLAEYQDNILKAVNAKSIEKGEIMKLVENLNEIKIDSYNTKALPPINIDIIKDHVYRKKNLIERKKNFKDFMIRKQPLDEFEKEEKLIKKLRSYKTVPKRKRNNNLDLLPHYIRDAFARKAF